MFCNRGTRNLVILMRPSCASLDLQHVRVVISVLYCLWLQSDTGYWSTYRRVYKIKRFYVLKLYRKNSMNILRTTTEIPGKQITCLEIIVLMNCFRLLKTRLWTEFTIINVHPPQDCFSNSITIQKINDFLFLRTEFLNEKDQTTREQTHTILIHWLDLCRLVF